jgi:hypothetical protein
MTMLNGNAAQLLRQRLQKSGFLSKLLTAGLLVVILTFSLFVFAVVIVGGALAWGYLWWKTRAIRKQMRAQSAEGQIIEGEVITNFRERSAAPPGRSAPVTIDQVPRN